GDADAVDRRDAVRPSFVVVELDVERLLERKSLDVRLEPGPAGEAELARKLELRVGELHLLRPCSLLRLLAQLLKVQLKGHRGLPSDVPGVRRGRPEGSVFGAACETRVGSALSADWL